MSYRCSSNDKRAVRNCVGDRIELLSGTEYRPGRYCRDGFPKGHLIRIDDPQNFATEILHGTRGGPDIKWVARRDQDDD